MLGFKKLFAAPKTVEKSKLEMGLQKTKSTFFSKLSRLVVGKTKIETDTLEELEEILIGADVGMDTTEKITEGIENRLKKEGFLKADALKEILKEEISSLLFDETTPINPFELSKGNIPQVIMVVGVNGAGKTTTIGKLAAKFKNAGHFVILGAADTFRAAAIDQLVVWSERVGVPIIKQSMGTDPASVVHDTLQAAKARGSEVVIIDTAGRLHNKINLMEELIKIKRVMKKVFPDAPDEVLLVLDGSTGQNAFEQAKQFSKATDITALAITKLDGTAKGGVVIGISDQLQIPVKYIGVGEGIDDLQVFDKRAFVESFFEE